MTRIVYKVFGNRAEMRSFDKEDGLLAEIELLSEGDGYIAIGSEVFALSGGRATVDFSKLNEGVYSPIFYGDSVATLEPIKRERGRLSFPGTPELTLRAALSRLDGAEGDLKRMKATIEKLCALIGREVIF